MLEGGVKLQVVCQFEGRPFFLRGNCRFAEHTTGNERWALRSCIGTRLFDAFEILSAELLGHLLFPIRLVATRHSTR